MHRNLSRIALVLALVVSTNLVTVSAANANAYYPPGCDRTANGYKPTGWDDNCWLGENGAAYIDHAVYVLGTQIILKGFGYYTIGIDQWFGPATCTAVRLYQNREGISSDGIVGRVTYNHLLGELAFRSFDCYVDPDTGENTRCWYLYSSPGVIGQARWHLLYDCLCWTVVWSGWEMWYSSTINIHIP